MVARWIDDNTDDSHDDMTRRDGKEDMTMPTQRDGVDNNDGDHQG